VVATVLKSMLSIAYLSKLINMSHPATHALLLRFKIPLITQKNKLFVNPYLNHPFCLSLHIIAKTSNRAWTNTPHKVFYTIKELSTLLYRDKKTVLKMIKNAKLPLYGTHKKYLFHYHFDQLRLKLTKPNKI
jgi:hypothetical protein